MTREQVHDLMENELRCVQRGNYCDRDCAKCPLVKDDKELIEAYGYVIKALEQEPTTKDDLGVDAVNRKAVHDMLENLPITVEDKWFNWLQKACMRLAELPSATPQKTKTGHWIVARGRSYLGMRNACCSNCKDFYTNYWNVMNYCPNCGAKMNEEKKQ